MSEKRTKSNISVQIEHDGADISYDRSGWDMEELAIGAVIFLCRVYGAEKIIEIVDFVKGFTDARNISTTAAARVGDAAPEGHEEETGDGNQGDERSADRPAGKDAGGDGLDIKRYQVGERPARAFRVDNVN